MKYYAIKDKVTEQVEVFTARNEAEAMRTVRNIANDKNTKIGMNPDDYELWYVAEFKDSELLMFTNGPRYICTAKGLTNND